ncbi:hypothetical protein GIB67_025243 [Kingdonia uniflora]|uniref:Uncharacterized protein n=1 Tax=Kingdonia uniflora TaxID=39325 RepID=A0A7J7NB97_9MAGN|nr:hypothetical protein GIB67_025243 [Kingdonia uniflora]
MVVEMSNPHPFRTKNFFESPALSLSLAGIFRNAGGGVGASTSGVGVEEGDAESVGCGGQEVAVEISSENTGTGKSEDDMCELEEDGNEGCDTKKNKKRKKYHRHTAEQIKEMEGLYKDSPHPDEKQRQQLSKKLGLAPRQVKFWFQNRRTQIKAVQERHENSLLKSEMDKLRDENLCMRETIKKACCPNCGFATSSKDVSSTGEQQLRIENAKLKAEIEKLQAANGKHTIGPSSPSSSCSAGYDNQESRTTFDYYNRIYGLEKSRIFEIVDQAMKELIKMATTGEPLWIQSVETGREILNYDEYIREFPPENSDNKGRIRRSIEASREMGVIFIDLPRLVQSFMVVDQWKEMFPFMISKADTIDVISSGEGANRDGAIQFMVAELQLLTPMVPTREVYFIRHCKQLSADRWAVVDVSIDSIEDNIECSMKCRKQPSGCIIEDTSNGHCKVIWVEHLQCQRSTVHTMYRAIVNNGLAFGAKHWLATLQIQCERLVFCMATNVPTKDSTGVATLAGRKSILNLAQRMTQSFCQAISASSFNTWTKLSTKGGDDIRISSRKNLNDPGEPQGLILCAVSSVWLPASTHTLFDFLRDEARRHEWDIMSEGSSIQSIANLAKGQDRGNAVTIQACQTKESSTWILQDSCTNAYESMVVYASADINSMQSVVTGCDSSHVQILSSGFSILSDGLETRPLVISSRAEEKSLDGGSLLTIAFQILANTSPTSKLTAEYVEGVNTLISCTLQKIKTSLQCEDS